MKSLHERKVEYAILRVQEEIMRKFITDDDVRHSDIDDDEHDDVENSPMVLS